MPPASSQAFGDIQPHQVLDQLSLLVDKSLVVAADEKGRTRYKLLETVRQYAHEKLGESGEAHQLRTGHRDHYAGRAATLDAPTDALHKWRVAQAENDFDNLHAAYEWCRDEDDIGGALRLTSALWPLWMSRGRLREATTWFDAATADYDPNHSEVDAATLARAFADRAMLDGVSHTNDSLAIARNALAMAHEVGDPVLIARALTACASTATFNPDAARPYSDEAIELARAAGDDGWLCQLLAWQCAGAYVAGDPLTARAAGVEGRELADSLGDRFVSRSCRWAVGWARMITADLTGAAHDLQELAAEAGDDADAIWAFSGLFNAVDALTRLGENTVARTAAGEALTSGEQLGGIYYDYAKMFLGMIDLSSGDIAAADDAFRSVWRGLSQHDAIRKMNSWRRAAVARARGDLTAARTWADAAVADNTGWHMANALGVRAGVALAQGNGQQAEQDCHLALTMMVEAGGLLGVPAVLECLAHVAGLAGNCPVAARLLGAAEAGRERTGEVRLVVYQANYDVSVAAVRDAIGTDAFDAAWAEGAGLSTAEAIAYAQRGRGERKRPTSGWESITPAELDVVRLVCDGLPNKDIATRLFVSPRTVQAHLTHVYAKLDITSRSQLIQLSAQRS